MSCPERPAGQFSQDEADAQPHETRFGRDRLGRFDADILAKQIGEIGDEHADKDAAASLLRNSVKPLLAKLTVEARALDPSIKSRREAQDVAESSEEYTDFLREVIEAERVAAKARAKYEAVKTFARAIQTAEANKRSELRGYR